MGLFADAVNSGSVYSLRGSEEPVKTWPDDHIFTLALFRTWPKTVRSWMTFLNQEHKVGNRYQQPPATAIRVVQPADTHRDTWDQHGQGVKVSDNAAIPDQPADKAEDNRDQDVEQKEHPVFFSACPAREHRVFFQNFCIPAPRRRVIGARTGWRNNQLRSPAVRTRTSVITDFLCTITTKYHLILP